MSLPELDRLRDLWRREREAVRERFARERLSTPLMERVARGVALIDLHVVDVEPAPGGRLMLWIAPRKPAALAVDPDSVRIGQGDPVRLWFHDPDEREATLGVVARRAGLKLGVMAELDTDEQLDRLEEGAFKLDVDAPEVTFDRGDRALTRLRAAKPGTERAWFLEVLFGLRAGRVTGAAPERFFDPALNAPQREAVLRACKAEDVALVHGPPGTGKTRTLVEVVRQAVSRGERVLATAASNGAVDNLGLRLHQHGVSVVRLGHPARVAAELEAVSLESLVAHTEAAALARRWNQDAQTLRRKTAQRAARGAGDWAEKRAAFAEVRRLREDARRHLEAAQSALLDRAQVVLATAAGAEANVLGDRIFDLVVLDEATQSVDPVSLVALQRGRRAVLAGDPCQLPPTVISIAPAAPLSRGESPVRETLSYTLFERVADRQPAEVSLLRVQHRMCAELMAFPSTSMYGGRLEAASEVAASRLSDLEGVGPDPLRPEPLCFLDTAGTGFAEVATEADPSTSNPLQAERTVREVRRLLARGLRPTDIGVITPYEAQARRLREGLRAAREAGLEVGTVDAFQGREKEAIVVDLVRSNEDGHLGFLEDVRRMNVALTRAKRFLLVIGDSATLGAHPYYRTFLEAAEASGAWLSAWSDDGEPGPELGPTS